MSDYLLVGLSKAGKTAWIKKFIEQNIEKGKFIILDYENTYEEYISMPNIEIYTTAFEMWRKFRHYTLSLNEEENTFVIVENLSLYQDSIVLLKHHLRKDSNIQFICTTEYANEDIVPRIVLDKMEVIAFPSDLATSVYIFGDDRACNLRHNETLVRSTSVRIPSYTKYQFKIENNQLKGYDELEDEKKYALENRTCIYLYHNSKENKWFVGQTHYFLKRHKETYPNFAIKDKYTYDEVIVLFNRKFDRFQALDYMELRLSEELDAHHYGGPLMTDDIDINCKEYLDNLITTISEDLRKEGYKYAKYFMGV